MNFTITKDTGNIIEDIVATINNFNEEELSRLLASIKLKKEENNIIGSTIFFRYKDCEEFLANVKNISEVPFEVRRRMREERTYRLNTEPIFINLNNPENTEDSIIKTIIDKIGHQINLEESFCKAISNDKFDLNFYKLCFKIIKDNQYYQYFLNFENHRDIFRTTHTKEEYLIELSKILGYQNIDVNQQKYKTSEDSQIKDNPVFRYNFITEEMLNRYLNLRKIINVDIQVLGEDIYCQRKMTADKEEIATYPYQKELQTQIDNDWTVNQELIDYINKDLDKNYNRFELISHIYIKLCYALRYNLAYHIKKWSTTYSKDRQSSITPTNNEIICSEFSLIFTNLINKLDKNIEARCIVTGKNQHVSVGIYVKDKNIRINFDSTRIVGNFDDLGRVKIGLPIVGIDYICDRNDEFKIAFDKVKEKLCGQDRQEASIIVKAYETLPQQKDIEVNFLTNLEQFIIYTKKKNIVGSELLFVFKKLNEIGYFGKIVYSIVGLDNKLTFAHRSLLTTPQEILDGLEENIIIKSNQEYYMLRLNTGIVNKMTEEQLNNLFESDKMAYFNPKYRIEGIGVKKT